MTCYVLQKKNTMEYLRKTDAWEHTFTDDLQKARIYIDAKSASRTMHNKPRYYKGDPLVLELRAVKISLAD